MILFELRKTFDKTNKKSLLDKVFPIYFLNNNISWYKPYLAGCHFTEEIVSRASNFENISSGISQGSIFGTVLFFMPII